MLLYQNIFLIQILLLLNMNVQVETFNKEKRVSRKGKLCNNDICGEIIQNELNEDDIDAIVELNNRLRHEVASGKHQGQPTASKMKKLVWNKDLATLAKDWAEKCVCKPSTNKKYRSISNFPNQGQNVACFMAGPKRSTPALNRATFLWFSEVKHCEADEDNSFTYKRGCNNYRQLVSGKNFAIGCGYAMCYHNKKHKVFNYVCNYGIGVSYDEIIYKTGDPGSKCRERDEDYPNLCVPPYTAFRHESGSSSD